MWLIIFFQQIKSSICLLRGKIYDALDNRTLATYSYKEALKLDVYCFEAFDLLTSHHMLTAQEGLETQVFLYLAQLIFFLFLLFSCEICRIKSRLCIDLDLIDLLTSLVPSDRKRSTEYSIVQCPLQAESLGIVMWWGPVFEKWLEVV